MPALRREVLHTLHAAADALTTSDVGEAVEYPRPTTERALEELVAHGLATVHRQGSGKATSWTATDYAIDLYTAALTTSPETSGGEKSKPADALYKEPEHSFDDFSGEVGQGQA